MAKRQDQRIDRTRLHRAAECLNGHHGQHLPVVPASPVQQRSRFAGRSLYHAHLGGLAAVRHVVAGAGHLWTLNILSLDHKPGLRIRLVLSRP